MTAPPPPLFNGSSGRRIKDSDRRFIRVLTGTHRRILAAGSGRILGRMAGHPLLILTTNGRVTGRPHSTPVIGIPSGADWLVVASNGGAATQPLWLRNIAASAQVTIRHGNRTEPFHARILPASERSQRWPTLVQAYPPSARCKPRPTVNCPSSCSPEPVPLSRVPSARPVLPASDARRLPARQRLDETAGQRACTGRIPGTACRPVPDQPLTRFSATIARQQKGIRSWPSN